MKPGLMETAREAGPRAGTVPQGQVGLGPQFKASLGEKGGASRCGGRTSQGAGAQLPATFPGSISCVGSIARGIKGLPGKEEEKQQLSPTTSMQGEVGHEERAIPTLVPHPNAQLKGPATLGPRKLLSEGQVASQTPPRR